MIWQNPNFPLTAGLGLLIASFLITNEQSKNFLEHMSMALLFTWAYLELTQGINYFRRILGLIVMIGCVTRLFLLAT